MLSIMPRGVRFWFIGWLLFPVPILFGDGVVIPPTAFAKVQVPDQSALIAYAGGVERLLIETKFIGSGTNFAWVVPLPAKPEVEAATAGTVPSLQIAFRPKVYHNVPHIYGGILALGALIYLFITVRPTGKPTAGDLLACTLFALGVGISLSKFLGGLCLLSILAVGEARRGASLVDSLGCVFLFVLIVTGLGLPALATADTTASSSGGVQILDRKLVGTYDTATLASPDGSALMDWLAVNGFVVSTNIAPVVREYAREGWVFVAAKVRRDHDTALPTAPHPLVFTFKTDKPVYPLRLTGAGHDNCRVDLYVFGPGRAAIPLFQVDRCEQPSYQEGQATGHLHIRHPQILKLATNCPVATKLSADLSREEMRQDAWIAWQPFAAKRPFVFSRTGGLVMAANVGLAILGLGLAGLTVSRRLRKTTLSPWPGVARWCGAAVISAAIIYGLLPKTAVTVSRMPARYVNMYHRSTGTILQGKWEEHMKTGDQPAVPSLDWLRATKARTDRWQRDPRWQINPFTGLPWREEDSPGNYIFRQTNKGWEYVWYSLDGEENVILVY